MRVNLCHLGRGLTLQHFRYNTECGVLEELEPIDQNLRYDFNYQQTTILPKERLVLPVSQHDMVKLESWGLFLMLVCDKFSRPNTS